MFSANTFLKNLYVSEVKADLAKHTSEQQGVITEEGIADLPAPVQKYFRYCGYIGKKKMTNAEALWQLDTGNYDYFKGSITDLVFDVKKPGTG